MHLRQLCNDLATIAVGELRVRNRLVISGKYTSADTGEITRSPSIHVSHSLKHDPILRTISIRPRRDGRDSIESNLVRLSVVDH